MVMGVTIAALVSAASPGSTDAGTAELAVTANALDALASGDKARIEAAIPEGLLVDDTGFGEDSIAAFARYAEECPLRQIAVADAHGTAPPGVSVVEVRWACPGGRADNEAWFRFVDGALERIMFRAMTIIRTR